MQGYDLNYAGQIIGSDVRFDTTSGRIAVDHIELAFTPQNVLLSARNC
ncbi:DUF2075 family protein [Herbiconiux flava]|uniref:DUF2075 family protein n=1 Tax=Herbiconiux flava TaxID=881268 RepID=A0A852SQD0_9MICO|nr:hypothetical protein [Herbiconiux flava]NYD70992.1 DUF2075 family protein [Herbiconiux flava]GLK19043.1 hypothetical protein GCM10017602_35250 [Herbiconiux flava]